MKNSTKTNIENLYYLYIGRFRKLQYETIGDSHQFLSMIENVELFINAVNITVLSELLNTETKRDGQIEIFLHKIEEFIRKNNPSDLIDSSMKMNHSLREEYYDNQMKYNYSHILEQYQQQIINPLSNELPDKKRIGVGELFTFFESKGSGLKKTLSAINTYFNENKSPEKVENIFSIAEDIVCKPLPTKNVSSFG